MLVLITEGFQLPVMAGVLVELSGNSGAALLWHSGPICAKVGTISEATVIVMVVVEAHCPSAGVNVYIVVPVVLVLITAGFQVPVTAGVLVELSGSTGAALFWHSGPICAKVGTISEATVIVMVVVEAHCPASGVNV